MKKKFDVSWGEGGTSLFLELAEGMRVLDYEFDNSYIHEKCGGKCYYTSRSGLKGAGFIEKLDDLIPVGYYRVDTVRNTFLHPMSVGNNVQIMFPYKSHERDKGETLGEYPVVILVGVDTVIYADYWDSQGGFRKILKKVLAGKQLEQEAKILRRNFASEEKYWETPTEVVELKFYNFFWKKSFYPWEFAGELLKDFRAPYPQERIYQLLGLTNNHDWIVRTARIGNELYGVEALEKDPCECLEETISGWELADTNLVYKVRQDDVHLVGWELTEKVYGEKLARIARYFPDAEKEFREYVKKYQPSTKYVEAEITVPKLLFFLDKEEQYKNIKKELAKKVRKDIFRLMRFYVNTSAE